MKKFFYTLVALLFIGLVTPSCSTNDDIIDEIDTSIIETPNTSGDEDGHKAKPPR